MYGLYVVKKPLHWHNKQDICIRFLWLTKQINDIEHVIHFKEPTYESQKLLRMYINIVTEYWVYAGNTGGIATTAYWVSSVICN